MYTNFVYSAELDLSKLIRLPYHRYKNTSKYTPYKRRKKQKEKNTVLSEKALGILKEYLQLSLYTTYSKVRMEVSPIATVHILRHSFATYLVEDDVNLPDHSRY